MIRTLFSLRPDQDDTEVVTESDDAEPTTESGSVNGDQPPPPHPAAQPTEEVLEEEEVPPSEHTIEVEEDVYAAVQEAIHMYMKAGLSEERAKDLLRKMGVPGKLFPCFMLLYKFLLPVYHLFQRISSGFVTLPSPVKAKPKGRKRRPAASQPAPAAVSTPSSTATLNKMQPPKKTPLQLRVLGGLGCASFK